MKIEDRLRRELHDTAEHLIIRPDDYERVLRVGRRRRRTAMLAGASLSVTAVIAVMVVLSMRPEVDVPVASSTSSLPAPTTTATTEPSQQPGVSLTTGLAVAGVDGIRIHDLASGQVAHMQSDQWYESISWAISDGQGGLVFVHEITPLPWEQGSIMWLPAGADSPHPLIAPGAGELMVPIDMIDGTLTAVYRYDHRGGSELRTVDLSGPSTDPLFEPAQPLHDAAVDDEIVAVVSGTDCLTVEFVSAFGGGPIDVGFPAGECLPSMSDLGMAGGFLYTIEGGVESNQLVVRHLATGATVDSIEVGDAWQLSVGADGTVAYSNGVDTTVGSFNEGAFDPEWQVALSGGISLTGEIRVADGTTLGSGEGSLPCTPVTSDDQLPSQDLSESASLTRQLLYSMAASCDLAGLAERAAADGTSLGFDDSVAPMRYLVASARRGFDVAAWITRMLTTEPAATDQGYAWPAVFVTGSEEDWDAISGTLTAAEYEQLRSAGDYLGFRLAISADGRWLFATAGD